MIPLFFVPVSGLSAISSKSTLPLQAVPIATSQRSAANVLSVFTSSSADQSAFSAAQIFSASLSVAHLVWFALCIKSQRKVLCLASFHCRQSSFADSPLFRITSPGVFSRSVVAPIPSCPKLFLPQHMTPLRKAREVARMHVWWLLIVHAVALTPVGKAKD